MGTKRKAIWAYMYQAKLGNDWHGKRNMKMNQDYNECHIELNTRTKAWEILDKDDSVIIGGFSSRETAKSYLYYLIYSMK